MSSTIQDFKVEPSVRLTNQEWQEYNQPDLDDKAKREKPVYDELRRSFEKEIYSNNFDPSICIHQAKVITEFLYGQIYTKPIPDELSDRVSMVRGIFNKLAPPTFPDATFILVLWGLYFADFTKFHTGRNFQWLAEDLIYLHFRRHDALVQKYLRSRAINPDDPSSFEGLDLKGPLMDVRLSGPEKARLLRRFWPHLVERGLLHGQQLIHGSDLHLSFKTFAEVEGYFTANPTLSVLQFLRTVGASHIVRGRDNHAGIGTGSIDSQWVRRSEGQSATHAGEAPRGQDLPPGRIPPISLLNPDSWRPYLRPRQIENFQSSESSPSEKTRLLKQLWGHVPQTGIVVAFIPGIVTVPGIIIDRGYITFPESSILPLEEFFTGHSHWTSLDFANLLGFCLRRKEEALQGRNSLAHDPAQNVNYWIASKVQTVEQAVKRFTRVYAAWQDEQQVLEQSI